MRIESSVTAISWIPADAIDGLPKLPFELGVRRYDSAPPDRLEPGDVERLCDQDRFRHANRLAAWIEVEDGRIVGHGLQGSGLIGDTTLSLGLGKVRIAGVAFDQLRPQPQVGEDFVRFVQTVGGRAGFPAPRIVSGRPFMRVSSATTWTTLALAINIDGSSHHELIGASTFPRHWIYDREGRIVQKAGIIDFKRWYREAHGNSTPWGDEESETFVTASETALERELSRQMISQGVSLERRSLSMGDTLVEQGEQGRDMFLLLDGMLGVEVDEEQVAEIGPGAILGEGALLGDGTRLATLRARTTCRVGVIPPDVIERSAMRQLATTRRADPG